MRQAGNKPGPERITDMAIKETRKQLGLSQRALSEAFNIPLRTIEDWERGVRNPPEWVERLLLDKLNQYKGGARRAAKLTMRDVLNKEGCGELTAAERRHILKVEQAKEYSGWAAYPSTCAAIMEHLPTDIWERYTAKQIGEIMQIAHTAYIAGRKAVDNSDS
jgi:DNA-binding XRE family transcriptional regulator